MQNREYVNISITRSVLSGMEHECKGLKDYEQFLNLLCVGFFFFLKSNIFTDAPTEIY